MTVLEYSALSLFMIALHRLAMWLASLASNHIGCHLWVPVQQVAILISCPKMTLAVDRDVKPQL